MKASVEPSAAKTTPPPVSSVVSWLPPAAGAGAGAGAATATACAWGWSPVAATWGTAATVASFLSVAALAASPAAFSAASALEAPNFSIRSAIDWRSRRKGANAASRIERPSSM
jgi:hypothetical protein